MRALMAAIALSVALGLTSARAEAQAFESPYAAEVRRHLYQQLEKQPSRALGWELLVPGGGNYYTGLRAPAIATLVASLGGAAMWVGGALRDRPGLTYAGIATFACARGYGLISAPIGALLLNAAYRRHIGLTARF